MSVLLRPDGMAARQKVQALSGDEVRWLMDAEPMLRKLGLSFYCPNCSRLGLADGVRGNNSVTADTYVVECGCTARKWAANHGRQAS